MQEVRKNISSVLIVWVQPTIATFGFPLFCLYTHNCFIGFLSEYLLHSVSAACYILHSLHLSNFWFLFFFFIFRWQFFLSLCKRRQYTWIAFESCITKHWLRTSTNSHCHVCNTFLKKAYFDVRVVMKSNCIIFSYGKLRLFIRQITGSYGFESIVMTYNVYMNSKTRANKHIYQSEMSEFS